MRMYHAVIPLLIVSGCTSGPSGESALCARAQGPIKAHASALVEDGGPKSVSTGRTLIAIIDAGCGR